MNSLVFIHLLIVYFNVNAIENSADGKAISFTSAIMFMTAKKSGAL